MREAVPAVLNGVGLAIVARKQGYCQYSLRLRRIPDLGRKRKQSRWEGAPSTMYQPSDTVQLSDVFSSESAQSLVADS